MEFEKLIKEAWKNPLESTLTKQHKLPEKERIIFINKNYKSQFNIILKAVLNYNNFCLFIFYKPNNKELIMNNILASVAKVDINKITNPQHLENGDCDKLSQIAKKLTDIDNIYMEEINLKTIEDIEHSCLKSPFRLYKNKIVIIESLKCINSNENKEQIISELEKISKQYNILFVIKDDLQK